MVAGTEFGHVFAFCIFVVVHTGITGTYLAFNTPAFAQNPLMSDTDTAAIHITVVAMVAQFLEHVERQLETGHVILSAQGVYTDKCTVELLAGPEAYACMGQPVFGLFVVVLLEWVITRR